MTSSEKLHHPPFLNPFIKINLIYSDIKYDMFIFPPVPKMAYGAPSPLADYKQSSSRPDKPSIFSLRLSLSLLSIFFLSPESLEKFFFFFRLGLRGRTCPRLRISVCPETVNGNAPTYLMIGTSKMEDVFIDWMKQIYGSCRVSDLSLKATRRLYQCPHSSE